MEEGNEMEDRRETRRHFVTYWGCSHWRRRKRRADFRKCQEEDELRATNHIVSGQEGHLVIYVSS